jgi:hypothetical protein
MSGADGLTQHEIKVTPAMVVAGVGVFREYLGDRFAMGRWILEASLVRDVFYAMRDAGESPQQSGTIGPLRPPSGLPVHRIGEGGPASAMDGAVS